MLEQIKTLSEHLAVSPQLSAADMPALAQAGYKSVIINRPDFEAGADQPTSADVIKAAEQAGVVAVYQPVISGAMTADDIARFKELLATLPTPIVAYCRSGTRCTNLFMAAQTL